MNQETGLKIEALSKNEEGKLAYQTMEALINQLSQTVEFKDALVKNFFKGSRRGESQRDNYVSLAKGNSQYSVDFHLDVTREDYGVSNATMRVDKLDMTKPEGERYTAVLCLSSQYDEGDSDNKFRGGNIFLYLGKSQEHVKSGREAIDSLPKHFHEIFPTPITL